MRGYLNEVSLVEALSHEALEWLHAIVVELGNANLGFRFFQNRKFFKNEALFKAFHQITFPSPMIKATMFKLIFTPQFFSDWQVDRKSDPYEVFELRELNEIFSDDSQCEASENIMQGCCDCLILNTDGSRWKSFHECNFKRSDGVTCLLPAIVNRRSADMYLARCAGYYPNDADYPPRDCQTILIKGAERFKRTNKTERNGRRQVFQDVENHRYYYVDNLHCGLGAHLEAFDSNELHLGEANIHTADITPDTKLSRKIKW